MTLTLLRQAMDRADATREPQAIIGGSIRPAHFARAGDYWRGEMVVAVVQPAAVEARHG